MIWFFTHDAAQVDIEVQHGAREGTYVLVVTQPNGAERVEQFDRPERLVTRVLAVQRQLLEDGWMPRSPVGGRVKMPIISARRRYYRHARRTLTQLHRTVTRRLAAAFGL
ncbi:MAG TPA: hypothetical protein VFX12_10885 [Vicinamibacterales bacterium]|nr:hypothetical protein [Vicinamibacterales bacterium]